MKKRNIRLFAVQKKRAFVLSLSVKRPKECSHVFNVILRRKKCFFVGNKWLGFVTERVFLLNGTKRIFNNEG